MLRTGAFPSTTTHSPARGTHKRYYQNDLPPVVAVVPPRPRRLFAVNAIDRYQGQAQIAQFPEQAMQRSLVGHGAGQNRDPGSLSSDGRAFEPVCPFLPQLALDPYLILHHALRCGSAAVSAAASRSGMD